jgi:hypothetical protein
VVGGGKGGEAGSLGSLGLLEHLRRRELLGGGGEPEFHARPLPAAAPRLTERRELGSLAPGVAPQHRAPRSPCGEGEALSDVVEQQRAPPEPLRDDLPAPARQQR